MLTGAVVPGRVLVTGAAQGLGFAIAIAFLNAGSTRVALADQNLDLLRDVGRQLATRFDSERIKVLPVDVADDGSVRSMTETAVAFGGGLDTLITCAGVISRGESAHHDWDLWDRDLDVNLTGTYRCARAAYPALCESDAASVLTVGSLGSFLGMPRRPSYNTSKAGVLGLTRTLAVEWGPRGIRVNSIAPGFIETPMMRSGMTAGLLDEERIMARLPLGRLGRADEIAAVAVFLSSAAASYITGTVVPVDGGLLIDGTFFD